MSIPNWKEIADKYTTTHPSTKRPTKPVPLDTYAIKTTEDMIKYFARLDELTHATPKPPPAPLAPTPQRILHPIKPRPAFLIGLFSKIMP